jgi:hypothetical protein
MQQLEASLKFLRVKHPQKKSNESGCFFPNISMVQYTDPRQLNNFIIFRFFRLNWAA